MDACPEGFSAITRWSECRIASDALGYASDDTKNDGEPDAVCNWCQGCGAQTTRLSTMHGIKAYWVCQKDCDMWQLQANQKYACTEDSTSTLRLPVAWCSSLLATLP